jgi:hypothetical protein
MGDDECQKQKDEYRAEHFDPARHWRRTVEGRHVIMLLRLAERRLNVARASN